jgi:hypothetical protein
MSDNETPPTKTKRTPLRLPFACGDVVYHRAKTDKVGGIVTGFVIRQDGVQILVTWGDDLREGSHAFYELTMEFSPFAAES